MEAHKISHEIEDEIKRIDEKREWIVSIHLEPYDDFLTNDLNNNCNI